MKKNGFTLVELLAVIGIIGILITIATASVTSILNKQKETLAYDTEKKDQKRPLQVHMPTTE